MMKRSLTYLGVGGSVLLLGVFAWAVISKIRARHVTNDPLRVTVSSIQTANANVAFDHYMVRIENVGTKTIRGFSLGHTCRCRGWDSQDNPYPTGINYTNPSPERQLLRPGDVHEMTLSADLGLDPSVWVDFVHFANDGNWGMNLSHKDGYVRGY
jgi:hypothetical protein